MISHFAVILGILASLLSFIIMIMRFHHRTLDRIFDTNSFTKTAIFIFQAVVPLAVLSSFVFLIVLYGSLGWVVYFILGWFAYIIGIVLMVVGAKRTTDLPTRHAYNVNDCFLLGHILIRMQNFCLLAIYAIQAP